MNSRNSGTIRTFLSRLAALFRTRELDRNLDDELRAHIDLATEENLQRGMSASAARTAALRSFGGVTQTAEAYRRQRGLPFFEVLTHDIRYATRQLMKSPGFTVTTVLTLALGIGVNTAMFSLMDAIVLHPLTVPDLNQVVTVAEEQNGSSNQVALANYESWLAQNRSFESLSVRSYGSLSLSGLGDAAHVDAEFTSANFFEVLRTSPFLGRAYTASECQPGRDNVVVLSYAFWKKQFAADPSVVDRSVQLDGHIYTVIGVMPKWMPYPGTTDLFLPLASTPQQLINRTAHDYSVFGRLRNGVTVAQAQSELAAIAVRLGKLYPATNLGWSVQVEPLLDSINGKYTPLYIRMVLLATGFVLLVVCANIANLQFVRGIARRPEIAVRTALGAGRARLLRALLTENLLLGITGAACGLLVAKFCLYLNIIFMPERVARYIAGWSRISINGRALAFCLFLAIVSGVLSGLVPAIRALRVNLVDDLKASSRGAGTSRQTHRLRNLFAIAQISLSLLLVIGAALMCKGVWTLLHKADPHEPRQILTLRVYLPPASYSSDQKISAWFDSSLERLRALPGVTHVEVTNMLPNGDSVWEDQFATENRALPSGKVQSAECVVVSAGYVDALHIPILSGRTFQKTDSFSAAPVALVSRLFAERYFPGEDPIGHRIRRGSADEKQPWMRIVGVVSDVNYLWIHNQPEPDVYINAIQMPQAETRLIVSTSENPLMLAPAVRKTLAALDPSVPLDEIQTYQQYLNQSLLGLRYVAVSLAVDAAIGLLLAALGIFGVMANSVAEQTREIGLRMAMGATPRTVLVMILRRAAALTAFGVGMGVLAAFALARLSTSLLFGVNPADPLIFISITAAVTAIALLVCIGPARHAASIDPIKALRTE